MRPKIALSMSMQDEEYFKAHTDYFEAIWDSGGIAAVLPYRADRAFIESVAQEFDGFLFCGGSDIDPKYYGSENTASKNICSARDSLEFALFNKVYGTNKPILGICRGLQAMNVFLGGTLTQHIKGHVQQCVRNKCDQNVTVLKNTRLYNILEKENIKVNSFHHQAINILANDLDACAYSADGIIEAVCVPDHRFCMGVQWHPENFYREDDASMKLFSAFIEACK